jgi:hypothetical protein
MMKILYVVCVIFIFNNLYALPWQRDSTYLNIKINNDTTTYLQNEEQIVMNPKDTTNLVAVWRDFRLGYRQVGYGYSFDGGLTWGQDLFVEPNYIWQSDPGVTVDTAGNFFAVILSYTGSTIEPNGLYVYKSTDGGMNWTGPVTVVSGIPNVFEDKELIACDRSGGPYTGNLYVVWMRFGSNEGIYVCRSTDGGNTFLSPLKVNDIAALQWPVPCIGPNSEVYIAWISSVGGGRIVLDRSYDGGETFGTDITIQNVSYGWGDLYGNITVFSFPSIDCDISTGPFSENMYVAYMDDSPGFTDTDIYFTRSTDGGDSWSTRVRINDDQLNNGCDQFHPWLTVAPDGSIIVVFLDRRLDPGNLLMDCYMTTSSDGGNTWSENERITTVSSDPTAGSGYRRIAGIDDPIISVHRAGLLGEYIGVTASSINDIHPIWTDTRYGHQDVFVGVKDTTGQYVQDYVPDGINDFILSVWPNPARGRVNIRFQILDGKIENDDISLKIYDIAGRLVRSFGPEGLRTEGQLGSQTIRQSDQIIWNCRNDNGILVLSGVYFCVLKHNEGCISKKFILF